MKLDLRVAAFLAVIPWACSTPNDATSTEATAETASPEPATESVKPGINNDFLDPNVDVASMVNRFEGESREIAINHDAIVEATQIQPGQDVADVGAGTGLFLEAFANRVGPDGTLYEVDIAPAFVEHLKQRVISLGLSQVEVVECTERSVELPANSVDVLFLCDTYHHFEYPAETMATIANAVRPGGTLVLVDFERDPSIRDGWAMGHIRAPKEVFRAEIEAAGFEFVEELQVGTLSDNYFLRFRRS